MTRQKYLGDVEGILTHRVFASSFINLPLDERINLLEFSAFPWRELFMQALSLDLRERIVEAYEAGEGSHAVIA